MADHEYVFFECTHPACRLRFPAERTLTAAEHCPICGEPTRPEAPLPAQTPPDWAVHSPEPHLELLLDNIRSIYNVGSIFRTADGAGVRHLHLCGITPTPENKKLQKTALGASNVVEWSQSRNAVHLARALVNEGAILWALELTSEAENLFSLQFNPAEPFPKRLVLVVGNEVTGIDPALLAQCDRHIGIPMAGTKESLNVTIALGTAVYSLLHG